MIEISNELLQQNKLTSSQKLLLGYVQSKGSVDDTNESLAKMFGVTKVSITQWLARLDKEGFVSLQYNKRRRTITAMPINAQEVLQEPAS